MPGLPASVPLSWYLILSAILFALGIAGFLYRRNIITVFMSIELMLNAVNLTFRRVLIQAETGGRPYLFLLCHGGRRGGSCRGTGHYPYCLQESSDAGNR